MIRSNEPLRARNSFRIGGCARELAAPASLTELGDVLRSAHRDGVPVFALGGGTNTLLADDGFAGLVLSFENLVDDVIPATDPYRLIVRAGTPLKRVIHEALRRGWEGLEYFVGIPGTIGGAVYGNAGTRGHELGALVERLHVFDRRGVDRWIAGAELPWEYRASGLGADLVAEVVLRLQPGDRRLIADRARDLFNRKRLTQPLHEASAGCVFRNPEGLHAGALIERAGLKGLAIGGARVSDRHANFVVNDGTATAADVERLLAHVSQVVNQLFAVSLQREIVTPGADGLGIRTSRGSKDS
ncbi:MAG: UDP-N-acetylmuramate dehydrogenase [Planctomycetota bacterium]